MRLRVVVVGVPGVGKTTVVGELVRMLKGAELVTFGSVMLEAASKKGWAKHRDDLRKLPVEKQKKLQTMAAEEISEMKRPAVIVDTHLFIRTEEGFWPGIPFDVARALKPTHLVLVEASPEEVSSRRASDTLRYRDAITRSELVEEMQLARNLLTVTSSLTGAPMLVVVNADGEAGATASRVAKALRKAAE